MILSYLLTILFLNLRKKKHYIKTPRQAPLYNQHFPLPPPPLHQTLSNFRNPCQIPSRSTPYTSPSIPTIKLSLIHPHLARTSPAKRMTRTVAIFYFVIISPLSVFHNDLGERRIWYIKFILPKHHPCWRGYIGKRCNIRYEKGR